MGDVAAILGVAKKDPTSLGGGGVGGVGGVSSRSSSMPKAPQPPPPQTLTTSGTIPIPKNVLKIIAGSSSDTNSNSCSDPLPPIVPDAVVRVNGRFISSSKKARAWCWASFSSSARNDGLLLNHWVRAGVEYPEYPFARFNIHMEALNYRDLEDGPGDNNGQNPIDGERPADGDGNGSPANNHILDADVFYQRYLYDENWTQSETDNLLELCRVYELRWPVIIDRWIGKFGSTSSKKVEDLQHRYYTIGMVLNKRLVEKAARVEAENLAKALAASGSIGVGMSIGGMGGMEGKDGTEGNSKEAMVAQHALATAISASNSSDIASIVKSSAGLNIETPITANMQPNIAATNTGTTNQATFDLETERQRRNILDKIWERSKEEEIEEENLRAEIKLVDAQLRKCKKNGGHILAATKLNAGLGGSTGNTAGSVVNSVANSTVPTPASSRGPSPVPPSSTMAGLHAAASATLTNVEASYTMLDSQFSSTAPIPTPGTPYLQSGRLKQPATGGQMAINKTTLKRMEQVLKELNVNDRPVPTKRVCDVYDHVRKGILTLLTLQKAMLKKESEVINRRLRLEKVAGETVAKEVAAKAEAARAAAAAAEKAAAKAAAAEAKSKQKSGSTKGSSSGGTKSKASGGTKKSTKKKATGEKSGTKRKSSTKKSASGSSKSGTGSSRGTSGGSKSGSKSASGGTKTSSSSSKSGTGGTKASSGGTKTASGSSKLGTSGTKTSSGGAKSSFSGAKSSSSGTKSSSSGTKAVSGGSKAISAGSKSSSSPTVKGGAKTSSGGAKTSSGGAKTSSGGATATSGGATATSGGTKAVSGGAKANSAGSESSSSPTGKGAKKNPKTGQDSSVATKKSATPTIIDADGGNPKKKARRS